MTINDPGLRHDFSILLEATNSNPNGDPDAGNLPRIDPETNHGLISDVSIKRRIRDYVEVAGLWTGVNNPRMQIYVSKGAVLNPLHEEAYNALRLDKKKTNESMGPARLWMCDHYFDVRMFGAVMSTGDYNCGQVRGPVQIAIGRSVDPIFQTELTITRVAVAKDKEAVATSQGESNGEKLRQTMGRKAIIPYALFVIHGTYSPMLGMRNGRLSDGTGVDEADLKMFWTAVVNAWELDRSAIRGEIDCRGVHVFTHDNPLGSAPRHRLTDRIRISKAPGVTVPRRFADYDVTVDTDDLPDGIHYTDAIGYDMYKLKSA